MACQRQGNPTNMLCACELLHAMQCMTLCLAWLAQPSTAAWCERHTWNWSSSFVLRYRMPDCTTMLNTVFIAVTAHSECAAHWQLAMMC